MIVRTFNILIQIIVKCLQIEVSELKDISGKFILGFLLTAVEKWVVHNVPPLNQVRPGRFHGA